MKRKLFLAIIAVLVVCLMCGMLFVACNDDPPADDGGSGGVTPPPVDPTVPTDPTTDAKGDAYDALIDAFDAVAQDESKEFTFALQITEKNDDGTSGKEIFGIAMEQLGTGADRADYLYAAVNGEDYVKFNGFDLGHLFMTLLDDWFGLIGERIAGMVPITAAGFKGGVVKPVMVGQLLGDYAVSESGDAFMFELNLGSITGLIDSALSAQGGLDGLLGGAIGADTVTTIVDTLAGLMKIELTESTLSALLNEIASNYRVNFYFGFDGATADDADPFDGLLPGVQDARKADAKNVLNVTLDGTAELKDAEGNVTHRYDIDVDIDLNPFVLFGIFDMVSGNGECLLSGVEINPAWKLAFNGTPEEIVALVEQLGYINVTVDEVNLEDGSFVKNILTIHSNFEEGNVIAQIYSETLKVVIFDATVALGGVYDFDALGGYIADVLGNALAQADEGSSEEGGINVMGLITDILGLTNLDVSDISGSLADIQANGFSIKMSSLVETLANNGIDLSVASSAIPGVWHNADTMTISVQSAGFGNAVRKETAEISAVANNSTPSEALVSDITYVDFNTEIIGLINGTGISAPCTMKGTSIATGEEIEFQGYVIGVSGLDMTQSGKQTVTLYVTPMSDGESLVSLLADHVNIDLTPYPVFGILEYEVEVDVVASDAVTDIAIVGAEGDEAVSYTYSEQSSSSMKTLFEMFRKYVSGDGYCVQISYTHGSEAGVIKLDETKLNSYVTILDAEGNAVANPTNADGDLALPAGNYTIRIDVNGFVAEKDMAVTVITAKAVSDNVPAFGGAAINYGVLVEETLPDGTVNTLTPSSLSYTLGGVSVSNMHSSGDFSDVGTPDANNKFIVTLDNNLNLVGEHRASITVSSTNGTRVSSMTVSFGTLAAPADTAVLNNVSYTYYYGESLSAITVVCNGMTYNLAYDVENAKWIARADDGTELEGLEIVLEWKSRGSGQYVTANADALINNYINEYKSGSRSTKVYITLTMNGYTYTDDFTAYELYASDKTSSYSALEIGEKLDGMISNANRITTGSKFAYGAEGYGIYDSEGTLICAVTVKVFDAAGADVTSTALDSNGAFAVAGTYKVEYELTYKGLNQKFFHNVLVNAPEAEA